ncbi:hypothetical protein DK847_05650 [Aestuariivirga litoralis]|uniref:Glycosyltransferase family 2 protein n=1 Tax=Aestuariivirga litoralis TaxID=2650924 RepID=A0A2W2AW23_9HYPH|nr:hypothetical protein [Aestuariivirga litoralis]PZF77912.1 hypothetical protein DK847_05650 [Aestuariivirga litoralis]
MIGPVDVPIVCIIYNRARMVRRLVDGLRRLRPRQLLIVADGPKRGDPADAEACARARAELDRIDWDCEIRRDAASGNLGCRRRILTGLDWAFGLVERAIILEDDIDADPRFFGWAARMLAAYENRDDVAMLTGHNPLVWWPDVMPGTAGIPSRRGGIYGWATWRDRWRAIRQTFKGEPGATACEDVAARGFDPALAALFTFYLDQARQVTSLSWDVEWSLRMAISGRIAIVSPVNLVHNLGLGPDATITRDGDDMLFFLPRGTYPDRAAADALLAPPCLRLLAEGADDPAYDRARVLLELLVRSRDPAMARRLARRGDLPLDAALRLHLLPFRHMEETRRLIEHLGRTGVDPAAIGRWRHALGDGAGQPGPAS